MEVPKQGKVRRLVQHLKEHPRQAVAAALTVPTLAVGLHAADAFSSDPPPAPNPITQPVSPERAAHVEPSGDGGVHYDAESNELVISFGAPAEPSVQSEPVPEYASESQVLERVTPTYQTLLGRGPNAGERAHLESLRLQQRTPNEIAVQVDREIRSSDEYTLRLQLPAVFEQQLGRQPTAEELLQYVQSGMSLLENQAVGQVLDRTGEALRQLPEWRERMIAQVHAEVLGEPADTGAAAFQELVALGERLAGEGKSPAEIRGAIESTLQAQLAPPGLSLEPNHHFSFEELLPYVQRYSQQYDADPQIVMAIVAQESSFVNHQVHRDGTGHGLIGLDDNGLLPSFEQWSGQSFGRGPSARMIPAELQIEFLAKTIGELTDRHGSAMAAAREWHRGAGNMWDSLGDYYQRLIEEEIRLYF